MRLTGTQIYEWCRGVERAANYCLYHGGMPLAVRVHPLRKYKDRDNRRDSNPLVGVTGGGARFNHIRLTVHRLHHGMRENTVAGEDHLMPVSGEINEHTHNSFALDAVQKALKVHSKGIEEKLKKLGEIKSVLAATIQGL